MAAKIKEKREAYSPLTIILLIVLLLYVFTFFFLLLWGICTSFKINYDFFSWRTDRLIGDYNGYEQMLKNGIVTWTAEYERLTVLAEEALAAGNRSEYRTYSAQAAQALEQVNGTLIPKLVKYRGIKDEMGLAGLPFYSYKYTFKVFSYEITKSNVVKLPEMYWNSILYAGGCGLAATFVPCIAAYACARFHYRFSRIMHTTVIIVMMIPIVGSQPSEIKMTVDMKMFDTVWCLWLMRANFLGMYFLVFYDICKALPVSFSEAAKMDGANNFQIFFKIAMPLIKNTFLTVFLIKFIAFWNEYQAPMIYTPSFPTVAMGLNQLMSVAGGGPSTSLGIFDMTHTPSRMAAAVLTATPVCILFACFQKRLLGNLTMGGVKG